MAKKDYDKTLTRLIGILTTLSEKRYLNAHEFAQEYNVTARTIQKDIYQRLIAFPIEKNSEGKFKFIEGFSLNKSLLGAEEMILIALSLTQFDGLEHFGNLSQNIFKKLLYPKLFNPYFIKHQNLEPLDTNSKVFNDLKNAIRDQLVIKLSFENKKAIEIAKNLLLSNIPIEIISKTTQLSFEEIQKLQG